MSMDAIEHALGQISGKLDMLHEDVRDGARRADDLEKRLRFVEQFQKWAAGVAGGISMVGGSVFYLLKQKAEGL